MHWYWPLQRAFEANFQNLKFLTSLSAQLHFKQQSPVKSQREGAGFSLFEHMYKFTFHFLPLLKVHRFQLWTAKRLNSLEEKMIQNQNMGYLERVGRGEVKEDLRTKKQLNSQSVPSVTPSKRRIFLHHHHINSLVPHKCLSSACECKLNAI